MVQDFVHAQYERTRPNTDRQPKADTPVILPVLRFIFAEFSVCFWVWFQSRIGQVLFWAEKRRSLAKDV